MRHALQVAAAAACFLLAGCSDPSSEAPPRAVDMRIVTLAPHLAELVVSAGGESMLVGISAYTDFPASISALPVVGDGFRVDAEALLAVRPTLVLIWGGGGQQAAKELTTRLGLPAVVIETRSLRDISAALRRIGALLGTQDIAAQAAANFDADIEALGFSGERLRVFYQIGERPLYTVNGRHFISDLITRCGGVNVFADLPELAPAITVESVVQADPDVILRALESGVAASPGIWARWPDMTVNRAKGHLGVPADLVARPSRRLAEGGRAICAALAEARAAQRP